ncbi:hypothetical protein Ahy_A05g024022 isoform B [Arachis hypogaea]|uniref:J domain-containing protein n=1 Tax=Arachis hypogaea TaxID=3818 RepID=A0A445D5R0_ARAHY|nr:hypothetical protein Ahy_A05g024022 isoform B [Arachis hypogaea]
MGGKGFFRENFQPQSCSGKRAPKTGQGKGSSENVVIIDADSDRGEDVIIIDDCDECVYKESHGAGGSAPSRVRSYTHQSVISVDDDDESDDEFVEGVGELDSDASSSKRCSSGPSFMQKSVHININDSQVYKNGFVSSTQRSRETCSAKATGRSHNGLDRSENPGRNRYGMDGLETESSDSDCSDCEVLEACEQWERASIKKKRHVSNDQSYYGEHPSSSGFHRNFYVNVEMEKSDEQHEVSPEYSAPSNENNVKENQSTVSYKDDSQVDGVNPFSVGTESPFKGSDQQVAQNCFKSFKFESLKEVQSLSRSSNTEHAERSRSEDNFYGDFSCASMFEKESGGKESNFMSSSQGACEIRVNNGSASTSNTENLSEEKLKCTSFEGRSDNRDEIMLQVQCDGHTASDEIDIINEREKLKETDEYKQAIEEEWASRQRQLQIQAEEAQRLRKRKKAETKRILDMQRRQKERVEEVRETQKKDEEFMNKKEQLRVEIRNRLNKLEKQCSDMTSLLRGLGIAVGVGFFPKPTEVHAAYKRALFKFHPDRASKTDVREQVEAEEKFKLISRMKEKFLLTSSD